MFDKEGKILYTSPSFEAVLGYRPENRIGESGFDGIHPDDIPKMQMKLIDLLKSPGAIVNTEWRHRHSDGSWHWMEGIASNLLEDSAVNAIVHNFRDITGRKIVENELKLSEEKYRLLFYSSPLPKWIFDAEDFMFQEVNEAAIIHYGYSREEFLQMGLHNIMSKEDINKLKFLFNTAINNHKSAFNFGIWNHVKKNGERIQVAVSRNIIQYNERNCIIAACNDITNLLSTQKELAASNERFAYATKATFDAIWDWDLITDSLYLGEGFEKLFGYGIEDLPANIQSRVNYIHPDDLERVVNSMHKIIGGSETNWSDGYRFLKSNGQYAYVIDQGIVIRDENGKGIRMIGAMKDNTLLKQEEDQLKLLESVITNTTDSILITEAEPFDEPGNRIIYVNEAFTKMTGYTAEEVIGKSPRILQGPNSNKEELAELGRKIRNWEPCELTTINYKKNGEEFWVNFTLTPVADEKGWYTHWISIERDVTEQKSKELGKELLAQISEIFNAENEYIDAANEVCKLISKYGKFDLVEVWTANLEKSHMQLFSHYVENHQDENFYSDGANAFKMFESLVGRVWSQQTPLLWDDIENNKDFVRREAAKKIGLKAVLGIPLIFNDVTVGVLKIGTKQDANYLKKYSQLFERLEGYIGSALNQKKLESDLSHLFNAIPDILCLLDFKGRFLKMNKAGCELLGYSEEEILYHSYHKFIHPYDRDINFNEALQQKREETTFEFENRYLTKNGDIIWLNWYCNSSFEEGIIYATAKNITEEKKLRELNRQAGSLAKIGSWELDLVNQSLFWSDEVHHLHETDPKSFAPILDEAINFYREDFRQQVQLSIGKSISTGEPFDFEAVVVTAKKKELWVRAIGNAEFANGECKRIYGSFQDIQGRKEAEIRLHSLANNLPGVVFQYLIYPDGKDALQYVTKGAKQIWGFEAEEIIENNQLVWDKIKAGGEIEIVNQSIVESIESKTEWTARWKYLMPNGEIKTHLGYGSPNFLADGTVLFNSVILDVTEEARNEVLLEEVSKLAKIGSWEINLEENKPYLSGIVHNILETNPEQHLQEVESSFNFYREDFRAFAESKLVDCIEKGTPFDYEAAVVTANKNEKWVRVIGRAEMIDGKPNRIFGSLQDITERKKSEIKLVESETRLRTILDAEPECIKLLGPGKEVLMMNPAGLNMIEADDGEQILGKSVLGIILPEHRAAFSDLSKKVFEGESGKLVFEIKGLKGTHRWLETHAVPMKNEYGNITSLLGVTRDITDRKKAEEENRFKANLLSTIGQAAIATNLDGVVNYWNKAAENIYGWKEAEAIGKNIMDLTPLESNIEDALHIMAELKKGQTSLGEFTVRKKDGTNFPARIANSPIYDENNVLSGIMGISSDITQEVENKQLVKQYTSELERSNEELEQFAFVASHDLQEPLRMISGFMDQLQRKYGDQLDQKAHRYIQFATEGAKRMKQIILDLLVYSRASRQTEGKEEVDMNELLSDFKELRRIFISEKSASIVSQNLPTLNTYKAAITQILHCLLDNALKYSMKDTPPIIEIGVAENENEWEFSVKDNGIGIDPEFYDKIFIIFQRLHNKDEYEGTGIGLSIAKRHVEFLGGRIWLAPASGKGTVFYFTILKK
jgi:PAS domain S-box-containing protein